MTRIATLPVTDNAMWRKLLAKVHPDAGGEHELFIWASSVKDHVAGDRIEPKAPTYTGQSRSGAGPYERDDVDRIPFWMPDPVADGLISGFQVLTDKVIGIACMEVEPEFAEPLLLLQDCEEMFSPQMQRRQTRGASYKQLAAIAHNLGFDKPQRVRWYRIAESVPLADKHAGHILGRLDD